MLARALLAFLWASPALAGVDNPTPANFLRRPYANAVVLGDYVYIDGGELAQLEDGAYNGDHPSYAGMYNDSCLRRSRVPPRLYLDKSPSHVSFSIGANRLTVNATLSLPLTETWTNDSVTLRSIAKAAPAQDQQVLWSDPANSAFYTWGGMTAWFGAAAENAIWKFTADGSGGGAWSEVSVSNVVAWSNAIRTVGSAYATVNGVGYAVGGEATTGSDQSVSGTSLAVQGVVSFDSAAREWNNASSAGLGANGTTFSGRLEYAPFGPSGFLVLLGGSAAAVGPISEYEQIEWSSLWVMNLENNTWYEQAVTGTKPTKREGHCTVGVQGPNGTYEM